MTSPTGHPPPPTICRIVCYRVGPTLVSPAVVVRVVPDGGAEYLVDLQVMKQHEDGSYLARGVAYSETAEGAWYWPPRVGT